MASNNHDRDRLVIGLALALTSGLLAGLAFQPTAFSLLVWVALVPMLIAIRTSRGAWRAALYGGCAGVVFCFLILQPLTSAGAWTGWTLVRPEEFEAMAGRREGILRLVSLLLALVGGSSWALFAASLRLLGGSTLTRWLYLAPSLFVLIAEWARSLVSWDYQWGVLGVAVAELGPLRQLASIGGVYLLSLMAVAINVGILGLVLATKVERWKFAVAVAALLAVALPFGWWRQSRVEPASTGPSVAVAQHHRENPDYLRFGLSATYLDLIRQIGRGNTGEVALLVLPESVGFGAVSLDGTNIPGRPVAVQHPIQSWDEAIRSALGASSMLVVLGSETIEDGTSFNSLLLWDRSGLLGVYHKRGLVPFGEYQPPVLARLGLAGESQFTAGKAAVTWSTPVGILGPFICQEVLQAELVRTTVLAGTEILVTGGNDGVFSSPAVARYHAQLARLRAVESGRYVVRAMKTGVSAIIDPAGRELSRAEVGENAVLLAPIQARSGLTTPARWSAWPLIVASLISFLALFDTFGTKGIRLPIRRKQ